VRLPSCDRLGLALVLLLLLIGGCGDDDDNGEESTGSPPPQTVDQGCEGVSGHPNRASSDARGFVVACLSNDETSVHVTNVSSHVLMVTPTAGVSQIEPAGVDQEPGPQAALAVTGIGWTATGSHFVLPLSGELKASGSGPATVLIEPDMILTGQANVARYTAEWMASALETRGRALARRVQSCAVTAANFARTNEHIEDVLRSSLDTAQCANSLAAAIRDLGQDPTVELPRARTAILNIAKPVAEDRLISFVAKILAR